MNLSSAKARSTSPVFLLIVAFALLNLSAAVQSQFSGPSVTQVPPDTTAVAIGKSTNVDLTFSVNRGYHINSNTPKSELLVPTSIKLSPPSELMIGKITYPDGKDVEFPFSPGEKLNVYTGDFTISAMVRVPHNASTGTFRVHGELKYQACSDRQCFPPKSIPIYFDVKLVKAAHSSRK